MTTMGDKSVETLGSKLPFFEIFKQCWFFYFLDCTDHSTYTTLNWRAWGIRELTLDADKIEYVLKYRKASFSKSVSTTFVAHCSSTKSKSEKHPVLPLPTEPTRWKANKMGLSDPLRSTYLVWQEKWYFSTI